MLTIHGTTTDSFCDGLNRRNFLRVGALATGGLTLANLLQWEAQAATNSKSGSVSNGRTKSIINIYLPGGPTHMDTFDLKPEAPVEFRGQFTPIATNVPGMEICELMPKLAKLGDKLVLVRSVRDFSNEHSSRQSDSGWSERDLRMFGGRPGMGAVVSKLLGPASGRPLASVALSGFTSPGYLGAALKDYQPDGAGRESLRLRNSLDENRLADRKSLLSSLDTMRRESDRSGTMTAMDTFTQRAVDVVTSGSVADALDVEKEDRRTREMYGYDPNGRMGNQNRNFILARRLVEAGVRVVSLSWGGWDTHGDNFGAMRRQLPSLDYGLSGLITDLEQRGLLNDTMIMLSGEFGRTPRVNQGAGRDHWPAAGFAVLAGGGLRTGQVIGSTNRLGERPQDRPVHLQQVFATVYKQMGINVESAQLIDPAGRPQYLVEHREVISELI